MEILREITVTIRHDTNKDTYLDSYTDPWEAARAVCRLLTKDQQAELGAILTGQNIDRV